jgi:anthranilate phosphoribosyltransferase
VREVRDGHTADWQITPADYGLSALPSSDLDGAAPEDNARTIEAVLQGGGLPGAQAAVLLNAAAALYVSRDDLTYGDAVAHTRTALRNGVGYAALDRLRTASRRAVTP